MRCCQNCRPQNSARMFKNPAPIVANPKVQSLLAQREGCRVIEIGAGCLRNALHLSERGFRVSVLEVPGVEDRFPENYARFRKRGGLLVRRLPGTPKFEFAIATFVLETICERAGRTRLVKGVYQSLTNNGCFIISARGPSDLVTAYAEGIPCSDGYVTPAYSFARSYTRYQLLRLLKSNGFQQVDFLHRPGVKAPELLHAVAWRRKPC
jgi:hypothetical protein